jgi:outer membrane lipoprotein-sorting protein
MISKIVITFCLILITGNVFSDCSQKEIDTLHKQLNSFKTLSVDFLDGDKIGTILIQKPGMMRIDYTSPQKILIIIKDEIVTYYDYQLEELTKIRQDPKFLTFLAKDKIDLMGDFETFACTMNNDQMIVFLSLTNQEGEKIHLKMYFLQYDLNKSEISIDNKKKTILFFNNLTYNPKLEIERFNFKDKSFYNID